MTCPRKFKQAVARTLAERIYLMSSLYRGFQSNRKVCGGEQRLRYGLQGIQAGKDHLAQEFEVKRIWQKETREYVCVYEIYRDVRGVST